jgi:hypothetical protein
MRIFTEPSFLIIQPLLGNALELKSSAFVYARICSSI